MTRIQKTSVLFLLLFIVAACQQGRKADNSSIRLKLMLTGTANKETLWLEELGIRETRKIDSITLQGSCNENLIIPATKPGLFLLRSSRGETLTLLLEPGENVELQAHTDSLGKQYSIKGSPGSSIINRYAQENSKNMLIYDSLRMVFKEASAKGIFPQIKDQMDTAFQELLVKQTAFLENLIRENPGNLSSVYLLNQYFGPRLLFDEEKNTALFVLVDSALMVKYPANEHAKAHHDRVTAFVEARKRNQQAEDRLMPGKAAPGFSVFSLENKKTTLNDFKGKTVLLYFWQSMHAVSRKENIALAKAMKAASPPLPMLVCISFDADPEMTKAAVRIDGLPGIQLNDPTGLKGKLASEYNLQNIFPRYILVGPDGNIKYGAATITEILNQPKNKSKP